jgi:hypothetical protein
MKPTGVSKNIDKNKGEKEGRKEKGNKKIK